MKYLWKKVQEIDNTAYPQRRDLGSCFHCLSFCTFASTHESITYYKK